MKKPEYREVTSGIVQNLSITSLVEAATKLGPAFSYDLYVAPSQSIWARGFLRDISCDVRNNPLAPFVNLEICEEFSTYEWCLTIHDQDTGFGSKGI